MKEKALNPRHLGFLIKRLGENMWTMTVTYPRGSLQESWTYENEIGYIFHI